MKVFKDYLSKLEESSHYHALHGTDSWRSQMDNSQNKLMNMYKKQAERVQELENRNKELEYASKFNGELNEFLQKRNLPPNTLGRHVVDVVMDYVQELEKEIEVRDYGLKQMDDYSRHREDELKSALKSKRNYRKQRNEIEQQNKRYREYFQKVINTDERLVDKQHFKDIANEALESESNGS